MPKAVLTSWATMSSHQTAISNRNSSGLSAGKWLRAPATIENRPHADLQIPVSRGPRFQRGAVPRNGFGVFHAEVAGGRLNDPVNTGEVQPPGAPIHDAT